MAEADGHIFWYNNRWYEYTGSTLEQMLGWGWEKVHHPAHLARVLRVWKDALANGQPWEDTFPLRGVDGAYRWFLSRAFPIRDTQGKVTRWFGTNTDVEEVKRTQEALRDESRILELLNQTGTSIASQLDLQQLVQTVTDAATELSGAQFGAFFTMRSTTREKRWFSIRCRARPNLHSKSLVCRAIRPFLIPPLKAKASSDLATLLWTRVTEKWRRTMACQPGIWPYAAIWLYRLFRARTR